MIKRTLIILAILVFGATLAQAATHFEGTVKTVKGDTLTVQVVKADFAKADWVKEGRIIQIDKKVKAAIIGVDKEEFLVTLVVKKAVKVKAGDKVDIKKAKKVLSGC